MSENEKITNAEYMINLLLDLLHDNGIELHNFDIDDGGASEESMIYYNIACPYFFGDERAECKNNGPLETATFVGKYGDEFSDDGTYHKEFLFITYGDGNRDKGDLTFPDFDAGKMYSGMELGKSLKLEELGIKYEEETTDLGVPENNGIGKI